MCRLATRLFFVTLLAGVVTTIQAQFGGGGLQWLPDGNSHYSTREGDIIKVYLPNRNEEVLVTKAQLTPAGKSEPIAVRSFNFSPDESRLLIYTNTKRVWRLDTRGDYWVLNRKSNQLKQLGKGLPESSLMFAKLSPDGTKAAYVSKHNIYLEDLATGAVKKLTKDGTDRIINGTFDWVYEEEFGCRDGFRWSPDSKNIAFWRIDATKIRNFLMINNTDSIYSFTVPVEYPKVGEKPSPYKIGVVTVASGATKWMNVPGDPSNTYLPRMEYSGNQELIMQHFNRKQNVSTLMYANTVTGAVTSAFTESDKAWVDAKTSAAGWNWLNGGKEFLWMSEKDGWNHAYRISKDGKSEKLITNGDYDVISVVLLDEPNNLLYFMASPENATQSYLYKVKLDGNSKAERLSPTDQVGTHSYSLSPNGKYASHRFSNAKDPGFSEWVTLPDHKPFGSEGRRPNMGGAKRDIEFFKVPVAQGLEVDGWIVKPKNFDPSKKYPIVFLVYAEPAASTVKDAWGTGANRNYAGDMAEDGYIYASVDNRGTPMPRGREWRKAIYRNIGGINIQDYAEGAKQIINKFSFIDPERVAVHGWSGGGSSTLNLMFRYPEIFKTGIAGAAVANQLTYDNIYQERYMGLPQENMEDFVKGSPITHAAGLKGNLLYIHGTGDDNVHYQNAEMLLNELIKHNKVFQFMAYPNRNHGVGDKHLSTIWTHFLKQYCPPGGR